MPVSVTGVNISKTGNYTILITVSDATRVPTPHRSINQTPIRSFGVMILLWRHAKPSCSCFGEARYCEPLRD
ncbi:DUF5011 domain-containing protein [Salmonella enterica]|nr:DUF5011 domain-containing protein [Salmonella enterica]EDX5193557.1 DUF5011 domain-containing protein [Salmonella enterica subsp. enterica serovar Glostrup]